MKSNRPIFIIAVLFTVLVSFFVGKFNLYDFIPHLDKALHVIGGAIASWFFLEYFRDDFQKIGPWTKFRYLLAVIGSAVLVGLIWEFAERLSSLYGTSLMRRYLYGGDVDDTLIDLAADIVGAVLATLGVKQKNAS
ncbi:MAG: hypothetical protein A2941_01280 [Candidatus Yanofskybacteria bacterium RIFCSPLOWO2_01_FULL_49_17]|uniref:VanZ-like domain-containing protein n=1 Tax=Candidatus Yanofskybacteria bacterium RIFCSPLOWO2_01_FULL_49_17 TaxID=1802700 RepID=A0A1F8GQK3_9BACT|nr:MAG: hypothetical protein A2941_01280 [Candidatus Yanofskybacteria bacterium RIFCSPLOWO2_01_FULL_49_17]